jgi:hypothetical protein
MRTLLRFLGAVLGGTAVVLFLTATGLGTYYALQPRSEPGLTRLAGYLQAGVPFVGLAAVAALGGILWCLADRLPAPPGALRWSPAPLLRVIAGAQLGVGGLVLAATVGATAVFVDEAARSFWLVFYALVGIFLSFLAMSLGGILWCAVRVAYPEQPPAAP